MELHEKMERYGVNVDYSTAELLSILTGAPTDMFRNIGQFDARELMLDPLPQKGMTKARRMKLFALQNLVRIIENSSSDKIERIHGPEDVAKVMLPRTRYLTKEVFYVIALNTKNYISGIEEVSVGSLSASVVHPREVFRAAIKHNAASIILVHNHPSGDPNPSREDIAVTQRLVKAGRIMDIAVLDHVILGDNSFLSLKEKDVID